MAANPTSVPAKEAHIPSETELVPAGSDVFNGKVHIGARIDVTTSGNPTSLVVESFTEGPVYLTDRAGIKFSDLFKVLASNGVTLPDFFCEDKPATGTPPQRALKKAFDDLELAVGAFYLKSGESAANGAAASSTMLISLDLQIGDSLEALTGIKNLNDLFKIERLSLRALKCPAKNKDSLLGYIKQLDQRASREKQPELPSGSDNADA